MKKIWVYLAIGAASVTMGLLAACGNQSNNNAQACVGAQCPYGMNINGMGMTTGFTAQTQNQAQQYGGGYGYNGYAPSTGTLQIQSGFRSVLKEAMGTCDLNHSNGGSASCDSYMAGTNEISFIFNGGSASTASGVTLLIKSQPSYNQYYNYYYSLPSAGQLVLGMFGIPTYQQPQAYLNPLKLNATIWPVNNSAGFEIRANGPTASLAWNKLFQLQVLNGKVEDGSFSFQLFYNGQLAASGTMVSCQAGYNCLTGY